MGLFSKSGKKIKKLNFSFILFLSIIKIILDRGKGWALPIFKILMTEGVLGEQTQRGALKAARRVWSNIPFVVYPNSGETWELGHWSRSEQSNITWTHMIPDWVKLGTVIIGGNILYL